MEARVVAVWASAAVTSYQGRMPARARSRMTAAVFSWLEGEVGLGDVDLRGVAAELDVGGGDLGGEGDADVLEGVGEAGLISHLLLNGTADAAEDVDFPRGVAAGGEVVLPALALGAPGSAPGVGAAGGELGPETGLGALAEGALGTEVGDGGLDGRRVLEPLLDEVAEQRILEVPPPVGEGLRLVAGAREELRGGLGGLGRFVVRADGGAAGEKQEEEGSALHVRPGGRIR